MKAFYKLVTGIFVFAALPVLAQHQDFGSWNTFSVTKKLGDKFRTGVDLELRLRDNITDFNLFYTNFMVGYKPLDWLSISAVYRIIDKKKDDGSYGLRHRYYNDVAVKFKPGKFTVSNRVRLQWEVRTAGYHSAYGNLPEVFLRNKVDIKYKLTEKISPYVSAEFRWQFKDPRNPYNDGGVFDRDRLYIGADYEINHDNTFGLYFMRQTEFNVEDPETLNIIGLEYSLSLD